MKNLSLTMSAVAALTLASSVSLAAKAPSVQQQIQALQKMLEEQQAQLEAQRKQLVEQQAELQALRASAAPVDKQKTEQQVAQIQADVDKLAQNADRVKLSAQEAPRWTLANGRPTITSADGRSSLSVRALVQADLGHYDQDPPGPLATDFRRGSTGAVGNREISAARDLSDGMYFRRARFGVEGVIARNFNYRLMLELGGAGTEGPTRINDAWIGYTGIAPFTIQLGAFSPPANLEDGTTPDDQLFMERATSSELSRAMAGADGRIGVGIRGSGARWFGSLTYTTRTVNDAEVFDSQTALVGRAAALVASGNDYNLHLGLSGTYVIHPADQGADATGARYGIRFRDRPELRIDSTRLIDTGTINADHAYAAGAELAGNWRNFFLQAENFWFGIERPKPTTLSNPKFNGYYVEGSWVLTGESHRYNMATASYQNPRPYVPFSSQGGWGAWELAMRYSHTDLNSNAGLPGSASTSNSIRGGEQSIYTVGLNWYLNANLKLLFDYSRIKVDRLNPARTGSPTPFGDAPGTPPFGVQIGQDLNTYALRTQFSF
jgi:phosphate-selective porin OprO and OprP